VGEMKGVWGRGNHVRGVEHRREFSGPTPGTYGGMLLLYWLMGGGG